MEAFIAVGLILLGLALLAGGGEALVRAATTIAEIAGVTPAVIGLTVVAMGTSLVAAFRGRTDVAVANMIGFNIFNILGILGVTALVAGVPVSAAMAGTDMPWMIGTAVVLLPIMRHESRISRLEGGLLVAVYLLYLRSLFAG
jgi:cation:H+ antiporter